MLHYTLHRNKLASLVIVVADGGDGAGEEGGEHATVHCCRLHRHYRCDGEVSQGLEGCEGKTEVLTIHCRQQIFVDYSHWKSKAVRRCYVDAAQKVKRVSVITHTYCSNSMHGYTWLFDQGA